MDLDAMLAEVLAPLGVVIEGEDEVQTPAYDIIEENNEEPTCTMFQTSREHYGVFYRLDLIGGVPELRIFLPMEQHPIRMAGYRVRPASGSDLPRWFNRLSDAGMVGDTNAASNHVLFACGEILKNLFWSGNPETLAFPEGLSVTRLF
jgi:hypothetical protein